MSDTEDPRDRLIRTQAIMISSQNDVIGNLERKLERSQHAETQVRRTCADQHTYIKQLQQKLKPPFWKFWDRKP